MHMQVALSLLNLLPIVVAIAFMGGVCYGVHGYMKDELHILTAIVVPPVIAVIVAFVVWFFGSVAWPLTIVMLVIFTTSYMVKRQRTASC